MQLEYYLHKPAWLDGLLRSEFFTACSENHETQKKNERNIYCLNCRVSICQHCVPQHPQPHQLLQIRRYVYNDVIRLQEIQDFIDCALVQPYVINSAKVVFLKERPQLRPSKGQGNVCASCERSLQASYRYCSVVCMVEAARKQGEGITLSMRIDHQHCNARLKVSSGSTCGHSDGVSMSAASFKEGEDEGQLSPNCIFHGLSLHSPSLSWSTDTEDANCDRHLALHAPASQHGHKKLNKSSSFLSPGFCGTSSKRARSLQPSKQIAVLCASRECERRCIMLPSSNRRKGKPRRSPFC